MPFLLPGIHAYLASRHHLKLNSAGRHAVSINFMGS